MTNATAAMNVIRERSALRREAALAHTQNPRYVSLREAGKFYAANSVLADLIGDTWLAYSIRCDLGHI